MNNSDKHSLLLEVDIFIGVFLTYLTDSNLSFIKAGEVYNELQRTRTQV